MSPEELRKWWEGRVGFAADEYRKMADAWERDIAERDALRSQRDDLEGQLLRMVETLNRVEAERGALARRVEELDGLLREGLRCVEEAKSLLAPTTTNSDADVWIEHARRALEAKE